MGRFYELCRPRVKSVAALLLLALLGTAAPPVRAGDDLRERLEASRDLEDRLVALQTAYREGRHVEVLAALEDDPRLRSEPRLLNLEGLCLVAGGRTREAVAVYQRGLGLDPGLAELHQNLAVALVELGATGRALSEFEQALELDAHLLESRVGAAALLLDLGRTGPARPHLEMAERLAPRDPRVLRAWARLADTDGVGAESQRRWAELESVAPSADSARRLGELARAEDRARAVEWFDRCAERDLRAQDCLLAAAAIDLERARPVEALRRLETAESRGPLPDAAEPNLYLAMQRLGMVDALEARAEAQPPRNPRSWALLALAQREAGRTDAALGSIEAACSLDDSDLDLLNLRAVLLDENGLGAAALRLWRSILEADPEHPQARANLEARGGR